MTRLACRRSDTPYLIAYIRARPRGPWDESQLATIVEDFTAAVVDILESMDWEPFEGNVDMFVPQDNE